MNDSDHEQQFAGRRRYRRVMVTLPLRTLDPTQQPVLPLDPPQPAAQDLTISERFEHFHAQNPHVYTALRAMALAEVTQGARIVRPKDLVERLRSSGIATQNGENPYQIDNRYTSRYARLLAAEPELCGRIPMRRLLSE